MKRICIAISSNDKDTTMHLEIYAPEYKGDLKGLIQICHGMTEYTGKMSCASDKIYDLMFGTYGKKFKGRPANYWLLTDNEKRREYADDSLVRQDVSPAFFCEFSKGMECASRNLKNPNNTIPTLFLYGKKDPVSGFGKGVRKVYKAYKENNPDTEIRSFPGTHDILHDSGYESVFKAIADYLRK